MSAQKHIESDKGEPQFDPNIQPIHQHNLQIAEKRGLHWDFCKDSFVDDEGSLVRDKFGQPY